MLRASTRLWAPGSRRCAHTFFAHEISLLLPGRMPLSLRRRTSQNAPSSASVPAETAFIQRRSDNLLREDEQRASRNADRVLGLALLVQWQAMLVLAIALSPTKGGWGTADKPLLYTALGVGAVLLAAPLWWIWKRPGEPVTRFLAAAAQMGFSALFAHLVAGQWGAHYHLFASLALLALYRDWRVLALALFLAALELYFGARLWSELTGAGSPHNGAARWLEPIGWIAFASLVLLLNVALSRRELRAAALRQARREQETPAASPAGAPPNTLAAQASGEVAREFRARLVQSQRVEQELRAERELIETESRARYAEIQRLRLQLENQAALVHQAQGDLHHQAEQHRLLTDALPQIVWVANRDGGLNHFNRRYCEYTGLSEEMSMDWGWKAIVHPDDLPGCLEAWSRALREECTFEVEYRLRRGSDGAYRWHLGRAVLMRDELGNVVQWLGTCTDIDDQKRADEALRQSEERYRSLVRASPQIVWVANATGRLEADLPEWRAATGQTFEQLRGVGWLNALHDEDRPRVEAAWHQAIAAHTPFDARFRAHTPEGGWRNYHARAVPIFNRDGSVREWIGTASDVTEHQLAEEALRQAHAYLEERVGERTQQLSDANDQLQRQVAERRQIEAELAEARDAAVRSARMKSQFLANMSHEIRTPMNGVIGMTALLMETPLTEEQRDYVETIRQSGDGLLTIINDILDFSKIEAGRLAFEEADFDLAPAVRGVIELLNKNARAKAIDLNSLVLDGVPPRLRGDVGRLRQVMLNLLSNAVKFTPAGGRVLLRVSRQAETEADATLLFQVIDTGVGVAEDIQRTLFQPFMQADGSMTRRYGGTGLGLAICKQLVGLMHGEIGIESKMGEGSTFWFTVRLEKAKTAAAAAPAAPVAPAFAGVHLLVVEDNSVNQKVLLRQLSKLGCTADVVGNGQEAIMACASRRYDIVLMDCQMPEMDGFQATRELRTQQKKQNDGHRMAIVALTANALTGDRDKCIEAGMDDYVSKPVKAEQLTAMLEKWTTRREEFHVAAA